MPAQNAKNTRSVAAWARNNPKISAPLKADMNRGVANSYRFYIVDTHFDMLNFWGYFLTGGIGAYLPKEVVRTEEQAQERDRPGVLGRAGTPHPRHLLLPARIEALHRPLA